MNHPKPRLSSTLLFVAVSFVFASFACSDGTESQAVVQPEMDTDTDTDTDTGTETDTETETDNSFDCDVNQSAPMTDNTLLRHSCRRR